MEQAPTPPAAKQRRSLSLAVIVLAALLVGIVTGVAVDHFALHRHGPFGGPGMGRGPTDRPESPQERAEMQRRIADRMTRELDLTPEQRHQLEAMLPRRMAAFDSLRREMAPRLRALLDSSSAEFEAILTPAQRAKWAETRRRFAPRGGPPLP